MSLVKFEPARGLMSLRGRFNELFSDNFFGQFPAHFTEPSSARNWAPVVDIYETDDEIVIKAELPGMKKEDVHIEVRDHNLVISGERKQEEEVKEKELRRVERCYGSFYRAFTLPSTSDPGKINASMHDGVLQVSIPKLEEAKTLSVTIESN